MTSGPRERRGEDMVFVVGCPRSGTTWVQRLLAAHPRVRTGQESSVFEYYIGPALRHYLAGRDERNRGGVGMGCYLTDDAFHALFDPFVDGLLGALTARNEPGCLFVEKTPNHALYLPEIHALLPAARVIHVIRDARDTVASLLAARDGWGSHWAPKDGVRATMTWLRSIRAVREARDALPGLKLLEVRYEDLRAAPAAELRRLAAHLDLEWSDVDIAAAVELNAPGGPGTPIPVFGQVATEGRDEVREPEGFVRKASVGSWRSDLGLRDRLTVWTLARRTMRELGYPWRLPL